VSGFGKVDLLKLQQVTRLQKINQIKISQFILESLINTYLISDIESNHSPVPPPLQMCAGPQPAGQWMNSSNESSCCRTKPFSSKYELEREK